MQCVASKKVKFRTSFDEPFHYNRKTFMARKLLNVLFCFVTVFNKNLSTLTKQETNCIFLDATAKCNAVCSQPSSAASDQTLLYSWQYPTRKKLQAR